MPLRLTIGPPLGQRFRWFCAEIFAHVGFEFLADFSCPEKFSGFCIGRIMGEDKASITALPTTALFPETGSLVAGRSGVS